MVARDTSRLTFSFFVITGYETGYLGLKPRQLSFGNWHRAQKTADVVSMYKECMSLGFVPSSMPTNTLDLLVL